MADFGSAHDGSTPSPGAYVPQWSVCNAALNSNLIRAVQRHSMLSRVQRPQVDPLVCQVGFRQRGAGANQLLACAQLRLCLELWIAATVQPECRLQHTLSQVEGQE